MEGLVVASKGTLQNSGDMLLWLDLETTGSDETKDCIIEIGCVLTTADLEPVAEFTSVVQPNAEGLGRMMLNPIVRDMHKANGLLDAVLCINGEEEVPPVHHVTGALLRWLDDNGAKQGKLVLAGSGVGHFDRRFIARFMPQLDRFMRYWCIDIGVIRRAHEMWVGEGPLCHFNDGKTHRALDDARSHLAEAQAFRNHWRP